MSRTVRVECEVHFAVGRKGQRRLQEGAEPHKASMPKGRIPRVARWLALAHRLERSIQLGEITDYAELARVGGVTRARVSQISSLLGLAPDIQEEILFLPRVEEGRDPLTLRQVLPVALTLDWSVQRRMWARARPM